MAAPLMALEAAPQVVEYAGKARDKVAELWGDILDNAALTKERGYRGALPLAYVAGYGAYKYVYPPLKTAYHIEQQVAGVLDQLYSWLGGTGSAIEGGVKSLEAAAKKAVDVLTFGYF